MRTKLTLIVLLSILLPSAMAKDASGQWSDTWDGEPHIVRVQWAGPKRIAVTIHAGRVVPGEQIPYTQQPGDTFDPDAKRRWVTRDGKVIGAVAGRENALLRTFDRLIGQPLDLERATDPEFVALRPATLQPVLRPMAIYRKSRPIGLAEVGTWDWRFSMEHVLYLEFAEPLPEENWLVEVADVRPYRLETKVIRTDSAAIQTSHVGHRPDDPSKLAFLSLWLGDSGAADLSDAKAFRVHKFGDGVVFEGEVELRLKADDPQEPRQRNYNGVDIYVCDFSEVNEPGTYFVEVGGYGMSRAVVIADDVYESPARSATRGLYHHRSGIEFGPPHTDFVRPRTMHPDDTPVVHA
ncbi:MAG: cellulase N-terminal Ig-like domain-containing protein, partial [Planctomycetota bacterium]